MNDLYQAQVDASKKEEEEWIAMPDWEKELRLRWYRRPNLLRRVRRWFHDLFHPHNVLKIGTLPRSWSDTDYKMYHAVFQLFVNFIEKEKPFQYVDYDYDEVHRHVRDEMVELYSWWMTDPLAQNDDALWNEESPDLGSSVRAWADYADKLYGQGNTDNPIIRCLVNRDLTGGMDWVSLIAEEVQKKQDEMLERLLKIRSYFWV